MLTRTSPDEKAKRLLLEKLTPEQRSEYTTKRSFTVKTARDEYELRTDITIRKSDGAKLCVVIPEHVPAADQLLARKLLLETDETEFLRVANKFGANVSSRAFGVQVGRSTAADQQRFLDYFHRSGHHVFDIAGYDMRGLAFTIEDHPALDCYIYTVNYRGAKYSHAVPREHFCDGNWQYIVDGVVELIRDRMTRLIIQDFCRFCLQNSST